MTKSFRDLHSPGNPFILANVWDVGSARMMAALGAQALATSSAAHAFTMGRPDMGTVSRDEALAHAQDIVAATNLPVNGDFENGYGHDPDTCAETVRLSAEVGLAGIGIEDMAFPDLKAYPRDLAVERIRAAASAARALPGDFVLTARADGVMNGLYEMDEAIARCEAYQDAGADVVYVPMPKTMEDLRALMAAVSVPVNVLVAGRFAAQPAADYAAMGAARLSLGSALARATHRAINDLGTAMLNDGDFSGLMDGMAGGDVDALLTKGAR